MSAPIVKEIDVSPNKDKEVVKEKWWTLDLKAEDQYIKVANSLYPYVRDTQRRQMYRRVQNLRHARLYSNLEILGLQPGMFSRTAADLIPGHRVTMNVIQSCVDTVSSKIGKMEPRVTFLTDDGNWAQRQKAKRLSAYMMGAFESCGLYETKHMSFRDAAVFGTGATKFYIENSKVKAERAFIDEIVVDDSEGIYGDPQSMYQVRYLNRDVLADMFPEYRQRIMDAPSGFNSDVTLDKNMIRVVEGWHKKSGPKAKDGRHAIVIDNCTLLYERYDKNYFPFDFDRWNPRLLGFFGQGIPEQILGIQIEINKLCRTIQQSLHLMAVPRIFLNAASKVSASHFTNEPGSIVKFVGEAPIFNTSPVMPPEVYAWVENLYQKAYQIVGISQLSANAKKPAGLNSGVALREYQDTESERFELVAKRHENSYVNCAEIILDLTRDIMKQGGNPWVQTKFGKRTEMLSFEDVDMESDEYVIKPFPASMLPTQPAGRLSTVTELVQAGFLDKDRALDLLDFPDVKGFMNQQTASINDIRRIIEQMLDKGVYESPEPFMNLKLAKSMVQDAYLESRSDNAPEDRLELLRQFMADTDELMAMAAQAMAMAQQPVAPQAVPESAPQSDLLPQGQAEMPL
jgi:hypothetical protein